MMLQTVKRVAYYVIMPNQAIYLQNQAGNPYL